MQHTPYGYEIVNGKAVIDEEKAAKVRKICENYLNGMSFIAAATDVGLTMTHCGVRRLIQNKRYLGDSFYPAIISEETARRIEEERLRREKVLGRDNRGHKPVRKATVYTEFYMPKAPEMFEDPVKQAEYAYSLIQSEVSE